MLLSRFLDPKNDVAFKRVFGSEKNKDILLHFLNDMLNFEDKIEDVEFLSPVQEPEIAIQKQSIVDVLCRDTKGVQYIIEMQVAPSQGFEKRAQYYAAKAYCRQAGKGEKYTNLKEIIFIAISDYILFPDKQEYKSDHVILDKNNYDHDLKDFYFTFIELPKFKKENIADLKNIVEKWCYFFKYAKKTAQEDLNKIIGSDLVIKRAYEELYSFNWDEKELIAYEQEMKRILDNESVEDFRINQLKAAKQQGVVEGKAEGIEEGIKKGTEKVASNMLKQGISVEVISQVTGLSIKEVEKLR